MSVHGHRLESSLPKKYRNYYRKFNMKNIGIYRNFFGKYRMNIGIFTAFSAKRDVNKEFITINYFEPSIYLTYVCPVTNFYNEGWKPSRDVRVFRSVRLLYISPGTSLGKM